MRSNKKIICSARFIRANDTYSQDTIQYQRESREASFYLTHNLHAREYRIFLSIRCPKTSNDNHLACEHGSDKNVTSFHVQTNSMEHVFDISHKLNRCSLLLVSERYGTFWQQKILVIKTVVHDRGGVDGFLLTFYKMQAKFRKKIKLAQMFLKYV